MSTHGYNHITCKDAQVPGVQLWLCEFENSFITLKQKIIKSALKISSIDRNSFFFFNKYVRCIHSTCNHIAAVLYVMLYTHAQANTRKLLSCKTCWEIGFHERVSLSLSLLYSHPSSQPQSPSFIIRQHSPKNTCGYALRVCKCVCVRMRNKNPATAFSHWRVSRI